MSDIRYAQRAPSAALAPFVECYWNLQGVATAAHPAERVLPDGRIELVFNCGDAVRQDQAGGACIQPLTLVVGPTTRAVILRPAGTVRMFGIRLRHGCGHAVLRMPAALVTDSIVSLPEVGHPVSASMHEELAEAPDFDAQVRIAERHLARRLASRSERDVVSSRAVRLILSSDGALDIAQVARTTGISVRHLARTFQREVGVGPKLLARLARFHALLRLASARLQPTLAASAAQSGYVDQSHLVRDFREFAGQTPSEYFRTHNALSTFFLDLPVDAPRSR